MAAVLQVYHGVGTLPTILITLTMGMLIYVVQGSIIAYAGVAPFIVTLGAQLVFKGLILAVTKGATIAPLQKSFLYFGQEYINKPLSLVIGLILVAILLLNEMQRRASKQKHGTLTEPMTRMLMRWGGFSALVMISVLVMNGYRGMPVPVFIMGLIVIILTIIAERTIFGRSIYAIGGNLDAAKYSGINVEKNLVLTYVLHGLMVSIAGLLLTARLNAGTMSVQNMNLELDAIAAAVIGGTSMTGGVGKVAGAILGALVMVTIDNGTSMMNIDAFWQLIIKGIILVAAVWFDIKNRESTKS